MSARHTAAVGRRDHEGRRELPDLRRARPGRGRALAGPDQGRRRARQRASSGCSTPSWPSAIAAAADAVAAGEHDDQFPIDVFQTGSGTSSNMNANEVIANLAGEGAHPNDHVNMGQSSNDVFPSAVHLAALDRTPARRCCRRSSASSSRFAAKAEEFDDIVKSGRTHLMDAVPVTLGQEFAGYAAQVRLGAQARAQRAAAGRADPARRHRRPAPASTRTRSSPPRSARCSPARPGLEITPPRTPSRRRPTATRWSSSPAR